MKNIFRQNDIKKIFRKKVRILSLATRNFSLNQFINTLRFDVYYIH